MTDTASQLPKFVCDLLASQPKRGEGLNNWIFRASRVLHAFRSEDEIVELLRSTIYGQPVRRGEIERAVMRSKSCAWKPGESSPTIIQPAWPKFNAQEREAVLAADRKKVHDAHNGLIPADRGNIHSGLVRLWEMSPVRIEDSQSYTEEIIDALFPDNPLLCAGRSKSLFATRSRNEWRGKLVGLAVIVPNPMTVRRGKTHEGNISAHALSITGPRRFLVVEQDSGSIDDQATILLHLAHYAPLVLAMHSGSKSIHGWFACRDASEETFRRFMRYAVEIGCDPATWTRSQFVRMPDGLRENGKRQTVFFFNPQAIK